MALDAFRDNLRRWRSHPIAGIVVAGSTGEAPFLWPEELYSLVEVAASESGGRHLLVGTGGEATRDVVEAGREVAARGATAVLVRSPCYYLPAMKPNVLRDHFLRVADESPVPVILYHIPQFVAAGVAPELAGRLMEHPNIAGIKDSSGDLGNLAALVEACGSNGQVLVGSGALLHAALEAGASGGILAVALIATSSSCALYEAWRRGDDAGVVSAMQERIAPLHREVVVGTGIAGVKLALDRLGHYGGPPRMPLQPGGSGVAEIVDAALAAATTPAQ